MALSCRMSTSVRVFVSYARENKTALKRLLQTLKPLKVMGVEVWYDQTGLQAGEEWKAGIMRALNEANVVVVLLSRSFLASDIAYLNSDSEYKVAVEKQRRGENELAIIYAEECAFKIAPDIAEVNMVNGESAGTSNKRWAIIGDKLKEVVSRAKSKQQREEDLGAYFRWLLDAHQFVGFRNLDGLGMGVARRWRLSELFQPLRARRHGSDDAPVLNVIRNQTRTAVIGGVGYGKTTLLKYITYTYAQDSESPVPYFMTAQELAVFVGSSGESPGAQQLLSLWAAQSADRGWGLGVEWIEKKLGVGNIIVLVDGLDTVPPARRRGVCETIRLAALRWPKARWCVSSRPGAWDAEPIEGFEDTLLSELNDAEIEAFIWRWARHMALHTGEHRQVQPFSSNLVRMILENDKLRKIGSSPLNLTVMSLVFWHRRALPAAKLQLYREIVNWLLNARKPAGVELEPNRRSQIYARIAFEMLNSPDVTMSDARDLAARIAEEFNRDEAEAMEFIHAEEAETGLLLAAPGGVVHFSHQSYQEYFAGEYLASLPDVEAEQFLGDNCERLHVRPVLAFFVANLVTGRVKSVPSAVRTILNSLPRESLVEKAKAVGIIGAIFSDIEPGAYHIERIAEYELLARDVRAIFEPGVAGRIELGVRYDAAVALGQSNDLRLREPEKNFVRVPSGRVHVGAQSERGGENYDPAAASNERPVHQAATGWFEIGRYPVTVQEYARFVDAGGYSETGRQFWEPQWWEWRVSNNVVKPDEWEHQKDIPNCPVRGVSWFEVSAYCRWLTSHARDNWDYRLPTEDEWEYAARAGEGEYRSYVWGSALPEGEVCNGLDGFHKLSPVGLFVIDATPLGMMDVNGNVSEWVLDDYGTYVPEPRMASVPHLNEAGAHSLKIIRGGNFASMEIHNRTASRQGVGLSKQYETVGFRALRRLKPVRLKELTPKGAYDCTLADLYALLAPATPIGHEELRLQLEILSPGLGETMLRLFETLFPSTRPDMIAKRQPRPCRLGDNRPKFEFNLLYQDSRIKIEVEQRPGADASHSDSIQTEVALIQRAVALVLASIWIDKGQLWEEINDNDLDAIVYEVLNHREPARIERLAARGINDNDRPLKALPNFEELQKWPMEKVICHQIFAGLTFLNNPAETLEGQFQKMGVLKLESLSAFTEMLLQEDPRMVFIFDDNGELVWDLALIQYLLHAYPRLSVTGVTSSRVVANNAHGGTVRQCMAHPKLRYVNDCARFQFHEEDNPRSSLDLDCCSPGLLEKINRASFVFIKGVAGFETLQKLPCPAVYGFVVYSNDSQECTGLNKNDGVFVRVPPRFECFTYGNKEETLITRYRCCLNPLAPGNH